MNQKSNSYFKIAAILLLLFFTFRLVTIGPMDSLYFLHNVNLVFHEAGHTIFGLFGELVGFLGGMLGQLLIPLIALFAFVREGKLHSALLMFWWFGENFVDLAPYIGDARSQTISLIGGEHDFAYLLGRFGLLEYDKLFEGVCMTIGVSTMFLSIACMAVLVGRTIRRERTIIKQS